MLDILTKALHEATRKGRECQDGTFGWFESEKVATTDTRR
jgi:hypothetical protein